MALRESTEDCHPPMPMTTACPFSIRGVNLKVRRNNEKICRQLSLASNDFRRNLSRGRNYRERSMPLDGRPPLAENKEVCPLQAIFSLLVPPSQFLFFRLVDQNMVSSPELLCHFGKSIEGDNVQYHEITEDSFSTGNFLDLD